MQKTFKKVVILKDYYQINKTIGSVFLCYDGDKTELKINFLNNFSGDINLIILGDDKKTFNYRCPSFLNFSVALNELTFFDDFILLGLKNQEVIFTGLYPNSKEIIQDNICNVKKYLPNKNSIEYDDEIIATQNYYKFDYGENNLPNKDVNAFKKREPEKENFKEEKEFVFNEKNASDVKNEKSFDQIKESLYKVLDTHPKCEELNALISGGNFVKICYEKDKFYYVGTIQRKGEIVYICYGILSNYSSPPKNLNSFKFIPSSIFDLEGEGYYIIFQDAKTGKIV